MKQGAHNWLNHHEPRTWDQLHGFELLTHQQQQEIKKKLFPNVVEKPKRFQLNLVKNINDLTEKELELELQKRGIYYSEWPLDEEPDDNGEDDFNLRLNRLKKFASNDLIKEKNLHLVFGYCRNREKKHLLNVPDYLKRIVFNYFPVLISQ